MDEIVTRRFLQTRFWLAVFLLLAVAAASTVTVVSVLRSQAELTGRNLAFQKLGAAATRLELEIVRLQQIPEGATPDRSAARSAYASLLNSVRPFADPDDLADAGIGGLAPAAGEQMVVLPGALEDSLAGLLHLAGPLVQGDGRLTPAERAASDRAAALIGEIRSVQDGIARQMDAERGRAWHRALVAIAVVAGLSIAAILLSGVATFVPVARTVLRSHAALMAERDGAIEADTAKRNFLSVVSHELRTPMNGVLGFASLLLASDLKPEHRKQVEIIQSSGKSLLALLNDILDFSKLEAGSLQLEDEVFSIEEVVSGVVSLLRGAALAKNLEMSVCFDARLPAQVLGDSHRLRQVLTNLVGNAIKFTDSGSVGIEACAVFGDGGPGEPGPGGGELQLSVSDTGIGIAPDQRGRIFEQFTQVDSCSRRRSEGTGLGLTICKQLVEMMGGRIWVESAPGAGSRFHVRIPLRPVEPAAAEPDWQADTVAELSGRRILVVDDNAINRRIFRLQLESFGVRVDEASGGDDAMALLERMATSGGRYDAALIDQMIPETGGIGLARRIRADRRYAGLRLLLNTPAGPSDPGGAHRLGIHVIEGSPVLPRTLATALRRVIGNGRSDQGDAATAALPTVAWRRGRILLAEDDRASQELVREMLSQSRYRVDVVSDGLAAVQAVSRLPYDLVLMDIRMPGMGGIEAARQIRALAGDAGEVPIIALTAHTGSDDVAGYHAAGMQGLVGKPIDRAMLAGVIEANLDRETKMAGDAAMAGLATRDAIPFCAAAAG